jgi:Leucine-rich repeat (LRR) protein
MASDLERLRRGDLAGISELRLPGLTEFPPEVFGLADTLEHLDVSGGALSSLPNEMGRLHRLRVLFCSGNKFNELPAVLGDCTALSQISFRACGMRAVPPEALPPKCGGSRSLKTPSSNSPPLSASDRFFRN